MTDPQRGKSRQLALDFNPGRAGSAEFRLPLAAPTDALEAAFMEVHLEMRPATPLPRIESEFFASVGANHSAVLEGRTLKLRVSDLFMDAPPEVFRTLAQILLSKLYGRKIKPRYNEAYRKYTLSEHMLERTRLARLARGRRTPTTGPAGRVYDLDSLFDGLNRQYFGTTLRKPELSWTLRKARSVLGRYDFDQDVIFISRFLDSITVPAYVVTYILFHEMLHVKHGTRIERFREIVHTPEFRREEKQFRFYEAANAWLEKH